jgi:hypothetical protein
MAGMGPPPKDAATRRRRNATPGYTQLPSDGFKGKIPGWPLGTDIVTQAKLQVAREKLSDLEWKRDEGLNVSETALTRAKEKVVVLEHVVEIQRDAEVALWRELWRTPQAAQWHLLRWAREVAQFVRHKVLAENGDLDHAREARQHADRLGLSPMALLRLRWEIAPSTEQVSTPTEPSAAPAAAVTDIASRRQRLSG